MALYCYKAEDGTLIERVFPLGKAPQSVTERGCTYRRSIAAENKLAHKEFKPYTSIACPKGVPGIKYTPRGARIESRADERHVQRVTGYEFVTSKE
jgi:hypothetical protein